MILQWSVLPSLIYPVQIGGQLAGVVNTEGCILAQVELNGYRDPYQYSLNLQVAFIKQAQIKYLLNFGLIC